MNPEPLKFFDMFNLLGRRMQNEPSTLISMHKYNQELFMAIFWEESFFRNMRQNSGWDSGRSVGFGQVQWIFVNPLMHTQFKDPIGEVLKNNDLSVDLAIKAMLEFDRQSKGNKLAALQFYAGGKTPNWIKTSDALLKIPEIANSSSITESDALANKAVITAALELTRKDSITSKIF
jgi:hypothetical protein